MRLKEEEANRNNKEVLIASLKSEIAPIINKMQEIDNRIEKVSNGTLASLRDDILNCYYRCREKGYRNDYDYQNIHDLYDAYDELEGNSFIGDVMSRFDKLPTKEDMKTQLNEGKGEE